MEGRDYSTPAALNAKSETFTCPQLPQTPRKKKKKDIKNKRRFSDEQIRLLESVFESETKLEPMKKLQVAKELGLQPRQVAIWFQNRRARWKSKKIEQEYKTLRANYENLASRFESLKSERQSLLSQLQKLSELLGICDGNRSFKTLEGNNTGIASDSKNNCCELEKQQGQDNRGFMSLQADKSRDIVHSVDEGCELLNPKEFLEGSLAPSEKWYSFESGGQFDLPCSGSQWFNFWT